MPHSIKPKRPARSNFLTAALAALALVCACQQAAAQATARGLLKLKPQRVALPGGGSIELSLPEGFAASVAAHGLRRVRFMATSPDGRVFVTAMHSLADNRRGAVYVLDGFDSRAGAFGSVTPYLKNLRNPNSVAFYRDPSGADWLYLALTDRLLRYRYTAGEDAPAGEPEVLATFPDYGLSYKYGGWHLTRTVAVGGDKIYVSVGSSCNACEEREEVRASVIEMDADGGNRRFYARGLRNAVGLRFAGGRLFATNMGADHLGDHRPADTLYAVEAGKHYGWPYCYQSGPRVLADPEFNSKGRKMNCRQAPAAHAAFDAHSSPLGLEFFGEGNGPELRGSLLVALHGSTKRGLGRGYGVARVRAHTAGGGPEEFVGGFLRGGRVYGRPADVMSFGRDAFLLTDDHANRVYYIYKK